MEQQIKRYANFDKAKDDANQMAKRSWFVHIMSLCMWQEKGVYVVYRNYGNEQPR